LRQQGGWKTISSSFVSTPNVEEIEIRLPELSTEQSQQSLWGWIVPAANEHLQNYG
jgi:hypothetical protein